MSVNQPGAAGQAPAFSDESNMVDDLERWRIQQTLETDPANFDGSERFSDIGGSIEIGNLLGLERGEVAELVALEDYNVAFRIEQGGNAGTTPGSVRWDHSLWIRPSVSSPDPFIFDDPATEIETTENLDPDGDGNTEATHSISAVEANTLFEDVNTWSTPFNDTTNGTGGGASPDNAMLSGGGVAKNFRKEYGRGRILAPGDELGVSGFIDVDEIANEPAWMKWQMMMVFDVFELEEAPPTYQDIFRGSST